MDSIKEVNELNEYLLSPIERVCNLIAWWWEHCHMYPQLSMIAFDFLSTPGKCSIKHYIILLITTLSNLHIC